VPADLAKELAEDRDAYTAESVFWVPEHARWDYLKANATSTEPTIGALIDQAHAGPGGREPEPQGRADEELCPSGAGPPKRRWNMSRASSARR
jgi:hypothetical protein